MPSFTIAQLAEHLGTEAQGDPERRITGLNTIDAAGPEELTFAGDERHARRWPSSNAGGLVVSAALPRPERPGADDLIVVEDADLAMISLLELFAPEVTAPTAHIDPTACVADDAEIGRNVWIGAHCRVGRNCVIGDGTRLQGGVDVQAGVRIGSDCVLESGSSIYPGCIIGNEVSIHANAVIGADGFGYRPAADGTRLVKVPHIGNVRIEDRVEIGAATCIDRGKFGSTVIGTGTKIDNLCQIGHNVEIGRMCIICGQVGIAGTTMIGDGTRIGGGSGLSDHLVIGSGVSIGARSGVMNDIPDGEVWYGVPAGERSRILREHAAIRRLPELARKLRKLLPNQAKG